MSLPSVDELVRTYSQSRAVEIGQSEHRLIEMHGLEPLVPLLIEAYPHIRRSAGRAAILFWLVRYSRTNQQIVALAQSALTDRAYLVREYACSILAYALRGDTLHQLTLLQGHPDPRTRADAAAAVDAIAHKNHHFYLDRGHTGSIFWGVNPGDIASGP